MSMKDCDQSDAFRRGFMLKLAELQTRGQTKQAMGLAKTIGGALPKVMGAGKSLLSKAPSQMGLPGLESMVPKAPNVLSRAATGVGKWVGANPGAALGGAVAGTAGATALGTGTVVKNHMENEFKGEVSNALQTGKSSMDDWMQGMGANSWSGRLMMLLNVLFGGKNAINGMRNSFMSQWAQNPALSQRLRPMVADQAARMSMPAAGKAAPVPAAPSPVATQPMS